MQEYEITYLANPQLDEAAKDQLDEAVDAIITGLNGEISYGSPSDAPGSRRRLNYAIKDQKVAWLRVVQTQLDPAKIEELRSNLRKTDHVLRVTIVQTPRREDAAAAMLEALEGSKESEKPATEESATPAKKVTAEDVEKGIEKALEEEVK